MAAAAPVEGTNWVRVAFAGTGVVRRVNVTRGERVERGTFLATLDTAAWDGRIAEGKQRLARVEERIARSRAGASPELAALLLERAGIVAELTVLNRQREECVLYAPVAGKVATVAAGPGAVVTGGQVVVVIRVGEAMDNVGVMNW